MVISMHRASVPVLLVAAVAVALAVLRLVGHDAVAAKPAPCLRGREVRRADYPARLPIAPKLVVRSRRTTHFAVVTEAYAPGTLGSLRDFYVRGLLARGFRLVNGDAEAHEVESDFVRGTVRGHLRLNQFSACAGAVYVRVIRPHAEIGPTADGDRRPRRT